MKYLAAAAAFIAMTSPALAIDCTIVEGYLPECYRNDNRPGVKPPSYWDHAFDGEVIEYKEVTKDQMAGICSNYKEKAPYMLGCSFRRADKCYVFVAEEKWLKANHTSMGMVRRHEIAHCNGWPADHPTINPPLMPNDTLRDLQNQVDRPPPMTVIKPSLIDRMWGPNFPK